MSTYESSEQKLERLMKEKRDADLDQLVRENQLAHPPRIEAKCADLVGEKQLREMKRLVRLDAADIAQRGIQCGDDGCKFLELVKICGEHGWIDAGEHKAILNRFGDWIEGHYTGAADVRLVAEAAIREMALGLSKRTFSSPVLCARCQRVWVLKNSAQEVRF